MMNNHKKKILFFGTPKIAVPSLEVISKLTNYEIIVCVFPDRKVGRKQIPTPCSVKEKAIELNLPIIEITDKDSLVNFIEQTNFDLGIIIAFGMIFPASILSSKKFINVHFSLLPKYRGASPVQSAILNGDKISGITWQTMAPKLDSGDILLQKKYNIKNQTTSKIWEDFSKKTSKEFPNFLNNFFDQKINSIPQKESQATFCGKFQKKDGEVNFKSMSAQELYQKFCAFTPWPGIFIKTSKGNIKLNDISLKQTPTSYEIQCKDESKIFLKKIQLPGKNPTNIIDVLRGNKDIFRF